MSAPIVVVNEDVIAAMRTTLVASEADQLSTAVHEAIDAAGRAVDMMRALRERLSAVEFNAVVVVACERPEVLSALWRLGELEVRS